MSRLWQTMKQEAGRDDVPYPEHNPRGVPKPRQGGGLLAWRSRQKRGEIMRPSTFEKIERKASVAGATNPKAVAGAAYWKTAHKKFRGKK